jgi:hypothetical protein
MTAMKRDVEAIRRFLNGIAEWLLRVDSEETLEDESSYVDENLLADDLRRLARELKRLGHLQAAEALRVIARGVLEAGFNLDQNLTADEITYVTNLLKRP